MSQRKQHLNEVGARAPCGVSSVGLPRPLPKPDGQVSLHPAFPSTILRIIERFEEDGYSLAHIGHLVADREFACGRVVPSVLNLHTPIGYRRVPPSVVLRRYVPASCHVVVVRLHLAM